LVLVSCCGLVCCIVVLVGFWGCLCLVFWVLGCWFVLLTKVNITM
jgi:hypothetical protein